MMQLHPILGPGLEEIEEKKAARAAEAEEEAKVSVKANGRVTLEAPIYKHFEDQVGQILKLMCLKTWFEPVCSKCFSFFGILKCPDFFQNWFDMGFQEEKEEEKEETKEEWDFDRQVVRCVSDRGWYNRLNQATHTDIFTETVHPLARCQILRRRKELCVWSDCSFQTGLIKYYQRGWTWVEYLLYNSNQSFMAWRIPIFEQEKSCIGGVGDFDSWWIAQRWTSPRHFASQCCGDVAILAAVSGLCTLLFQRLCRVWNMQKLSSNYQITPQEFDKTQPA